MGKVILSKKSIDSKFKFGKSNHSLIIKDIKQNKTYIVNIPIEQKCHGNKIYDNIDIKINKNKLSLNKKVQGDNIKLPNYYDLLSSHKNLNNNLIEAILYNACVSKQQAQNIYPHLDPYLGGYHLSDWTTHIFGQVGKGWDEYKCDIPQKDDLILFFGRFKKYTWDGKKLVGKGKIRYYIYGYMIVNEVYKLEPGIDVNNNLRWINNKIANDNSLNWLITNHPHFANNNFLKVKKSAIPYDNNHIITALESGIFDFSEELFLTSKQANGLNPCEIKTKNVTIGTNGAFFTNKLQSCKTPKNSSTKYNGYTIDTVNSKIEFCFNDGYGQEYILKKDFNKIFEDLFNTYK